MYQKTVKSDVIGVNKEAYLYLKRLSREQRGCKPLTAESEERLWRRCHKNKNGLKELDNDSIGGGDGAYNGRWWAWDVKTLRQMLNDGGFTWVEYGERESIAVYI